MSVLNKSEQSYLESNLNEETASQLKKLTTPSVAKRVKTQKLKSYYLGVDKKTGHLLFRTTSGTTAGLYWYQEIRLDDLKDIHAFKGYTDRQKVSLLISGNISIYCNDPSFKYYGWMYMAHTRGYGIKKQTRYPKVRNPYLKGSLCKHLQSVLTVLPFHISEIVRDLKKYNFI